MKKVGNVLKKLCSVMLIAGLIVTLMPQHVAAASSILICSEKGNSGSGITIGQVNYQTASGKIGKITINFKTKTDWDKKAKVVSFKNAKGKKYKAKLTKKTAKQCVISVPKLPTGTSYTAVISGIKKKGSADSKKLTLKLEYPSKKVKVKKVTVDASKAVSVKFTSKITWDKSAKIVSIKDDKGKSYKGTLTSKKNKECKIAIKKVKTNRTYTIKISGMKTKGSNCFETVAVIAKVGVKSTALSVKSISYDPEDYYGDAEDEDEDDYDDSDDTDDEDDTDDDSDDEDEDDEDDEDEDDADDEEDEDDYEDEDAVYGSVTIEFNKAVEYTEDSYIIIKDEDGYEYCDEDSIVTWDGAECTAYLEAYLIEGEVYTCQIVKVKETGGKKYVTLTGQFIP